MFYNIYVFNSDLESGGFVTISLGSTCPIKGLNMDNELLPSVILLSIVLGGKNKIRITSTHR